MLLVKINVVICLNCYMLELLVEIIIGIMFLASMALLQLDRAFLHKIMSLGFFSFYQNLA